MQKSRKAYFWDRDIYKEIVDEVEGRFNYHSIRSNSQYYHPTFFSEFHNIKFPRPTMSPQTLDWNIQKSPVMQRTRCIFHSPKLPLVLLELDGLASIKYNIKCDRSQGRVKLADRSRFLPVTYNVGFVFLWRPFHKKKCCLMKTTLTTDGLKDMKHIYIDMEDFCPDSEKNSAFCVFFVWTEMQNRKTERG